MYETDERFDQTALGRRLVEAPTPGAVVEPEVGPKLLAEEQPGPRGLPRIDWAATGHPEFAPTLARTPVPADHDPLPKADVVVITWTSAEWDALHYVFSDALSPLPEKPEDNSQWRAHWYPYRRDFWKVVPDLWSRRLIAASQGTALGAPALARRVMRWGSYTVVKVGEQTVLLFKSDLHLNQDGEGLPLVPMVRQIVEDAEPSLVLSIGTAGGVADDQVLGDAMVTKSARMLLSQEFGTAGFNKKTYTSSYDPPRALIDAATPLLAEVPEFPATPPTAHFGDGVELTPRVRKPGIKIVEAPILTTDRFEYGTTVNRLDNFGCVVEMDDAVIAMELERINGESERNIEYAFVRNVSDPVINGDLPHALQVAWAVMTYQLQGLATSYNGAIATWALIAGGQTQGGG